MATNKTDVNGGFPLSLVGHDGNDIEGRSATDLFALFHCGFGYYEYRNEAGGIHVPTTSVKMAIKW